MTGRVDAPDATPHLAARFSQPVPFSDNGRRSTLVYLALSAGVLALAGGVVYEWRHERPAPQFVAAAQAPAETPQAPADVSPTPDAQAQSPKAAAVPVVPPAAEPPPQPAVPPAQLAAPPAPVLAAKDTAAPKSVQDGAAALKTTAGPNRLVLRFDQEAWAEVTDAVGRQLVSSLHAAGTERVVRGTPPYTIVIGNAQHVKVSYNNREVDLQPYVKVEVARFTLK
jgi:cytoskeleton protein RodZ